MAAIQWEKLYQLRFHFAAAAAAVAACAVYFLSSSGPSLSLSLSSLLSFFWPLLLSTAFLLTAVAVLRISPPPSVDIAAGEDIIEYVTSHPPSAAVADHFVGIQGEEAEDADAAPKQPQ